MMVSFFMRAVPSPAISRSNMPARVHSLSQPIPRIRPSSSKRPPSKPSISIPMQPELFGRNFPRSICVYNTCLWRRLLNSICRHRGLETDEVQAENLSTSLNARLDVYEKILSKQKYLAGGELTLADLFHLPCGVKLYVAGQGDFIDKR